jgi:hypothetical protein
VSCGGPLGGKRAQVELGALEILAQVEQAGPERGSIRSGVDTGHVRKPLQRADEDGKLEVRLRDTGRIGVDTGASQDGLPFEQLACARPAVPRAALGPVGREREQITVERVVEPGQGGLGPIGGVSQRRFARTGRRWMSVAASPALE